MELDHFDMRFAVLRLPLNLKKTMEARDWRNKIYVGGGYLRAIVSGEKVSDVDVFVGTKQYAELLAYKLCKDKSDVVETANAYTVKGRLPIQVIHRWLFTQPEDVANSFDFTICCAVISIDGAGKWRSYCDERFYLDIAAKRLVYRSPVRNEDAGGSMLRVLKYYQRGYRIPLDSLGAVIARLNSGVTGSKLARAEGEGGYAQVVTGLLRVVDPMVDPFHEAHLPSMSEPRDMEILQPELSQSNAD